jgi:glycosyltransferase involved in cell wall biosynthesis
MKILTIGDSPKTSTGYGTVWDNLLSRWCKLKPDWEFYHIGWQSRNRATKRIEGYTELPTGKLEYSYDTVYDWIMKLKPDVFMSLVDVGWQSGYIDAVNKARQNGWKGRWIAYTPIDTDGWSMTWSDIFKQPDVNVAMAKFGEIRMKKMGVPNVVRIDHGVDTRSYYPKEGMKEKLGIANKFVAGFVGRNQTRKMLDRIIIGFSEFAKKHDDVILMLHTDAEPPGQGWSLKYFKWLYGLDGKMFLTKDDLDVFTRQNTNEAELNDIYNAMDVFLYGTGGEGFGLPAIECQAAGIPLLMTDTTTALDLCRDENKIPVLKDVYGRDCKSIGTNGVWFVMPDDVKMAEMLEREYQKWKVGKIDRKEPREFALKYEWDNIAGLWIKLFEEE